MKKIDKYKCFICCKKLDPEVDHIEMSSEICVPFAKWMHNSYWITSGKNACHECMEEIRKVIIPRIDLYKEKINYDNVEV